MLFVYSAILAVVVNLAHAQYGFDCYGAHYPNWDDCGAIIDFFGFRDENSGVVAYNGEDGPEPSCTWWYWMDGNCRITTCWTVTNEYWGSRMTQTGENLAITYDGAKSVCEKLKAGGQSNASPDGNGKIATFTTIFNDPDQSPPSAKLRSRDGALTPDRFVKETVTLEQQEQWVNRTQQRHSDRDSGPTSHTSLANNATKAAKREEGDNEYLINNTGKTVRQEGVFDTGPRGNNGIKTSYSTTKSKTFTTTMSANVGAVFEIFSAGVSYEYSESESFSVTEGYEFTPMCEGNQQGQAFFYPFFDYYDVTFYPSGQRADIWLPVDAGNGFIQGEFEIQCLG